MSQANQLITNKVVELTGPGGMFELESVELNGINLKAFKHAPKTLAEVMNSARGHGDKPFCLYSDEHLSYAEFYEKVDHLAAQFQNRWHIKAGDRIAIAMRNYPEWLIAFTATALCGAIAVPLTKYLTQRSDAYFYTASNGQAERHLRYFIHVGQHWVSKRRLH